MTKHKQRGGSQIGWVGASWPLAGIEVASSKVTIRCMGRYEFVPAEVAVVEEVGSLPFISKGIRIHHLKHQYPEKVVFYAPVGRDALVGALRQAGFAIGRPVSTVRRGFPMRIPALIALLVFWNVLFLMDQPDADAETWRPGLYVLLALAGIFSLATVLPNSERLQNLFLREGRDVGEISSLLRLVQLITGLMLVAFGTGFLAA